MVVLLVGVTALIWADDWPTIELPETDPIAKITT
jgi:hypothetical protein